MIERGYEPGLPDGEIQGEGFLLALRSRMAIYFQESDRILLEREELSKHLAAEAEALRIRLIENHALFERALDQPQSLPRWLSLQWRRVRRKLSAKRLSES